MKTLFLTIFISIVFLSNISAQEITKQDSIIFNTIISKSKHENWQKLSINEIIINTGKEFLNTPYIAHTLEVNPKEKLAINFRELDCTTFLETCLCMAHTIKSDSANLETYKKTLQLIRYRDGILTDYCSRLHYFTDWIYNKQNSGLIENLTTDAGGIKFPINVSFMSTHPDKYKMLKGNNDFILRMAIIEAEINQREYTYIPKNQLANAEKYISSGDIIAITTNMNGLDISHVGYAIWLGSKLHFMHESSGAKKALITSETLVEYLNNIKHHTGIMLIRPTAN